VYHTDITYHGADLMTSCAGEFLPGYRSRAAGGVRHRFDPWGLLACGAEPAELWYLQAVVAADSSNE